MWFLGFIIVGSFLGKVASHFLLAKEVSFLAKNESWFAKVLSWLPFVPPDYMTRWWGHFGSTILIPTDRSHFTFNQLMSRFRVIIQHEIVHIEQLRKYGYIFYFLLYVGLLPVWPLLFIDCSWEFCLAVLPMCLVSSIGLALGRVYLEFSAYLLELREKRSFSELSYTSRRDRIVRLICGRSYFWSCPPTFLRSLFDFATEKERLFRVDHSLIDIDS
jgi:hypothetical protein